MLCITGRRADRSTAAVSRPGRCGWRCVMRGYVEEGAIWNNNTAVRTVDTQAAHTTPAPVDHGGSALVIRAPRP
jgi:hypothetical protein